RLPRPQGRDRRGGGDGRIGHKRRETGGGGAGEVFHKVRYTGRGRLRDNGAFASAPGGRAGRRLLAGRGGDGRSAPMEKLEHELWIVQAVNALFGPIVAAALRPLG